MQGRKESRQITGLASINEAVGNIHQHVMHILDPCWCDSEEGEDPDQGGIKGNDVPFSEP